MKVRAVAVAAERSNAIGTLELECTPHGLSVCYLGVGSFTEGYAPGALTTGTRVTVPWWAIESARLEGELLAFDFDPKFTPHNRISLTNFSTGHAVDRRETDRRRLVVRTAAIAAALLAVLLVASILPRVAPRAAGLSALGFGVLAAAVILFLGLVADRRMDASLEGPPARELFLFELGSYLPNLSRIERAPRPVPKPLSLPLFQGILPRTTFAVVLTLTASGLAAVLMGKWILQGGEALRDRERVHALEDRERELEAARADANERRRPEPLPAAAAPPPAPAPAPTPASAVASAGDVAVTHGSCRCDRGDTALWREPIPKLSTLVISSRVKTVKSHPEMELELAAVNNSDQEIRELEIHLDFFEKDPGSRNKRHSVAHRVVYFEGPLVPGQAIKWSIEADGSEFEVQNPIEGDIGPGGDGAAPVSRFVELLEANHRPVRLHGAMMLAYLGDPRAREAALELRDALREDEAPYLHRVLQAVNDVRACRLRVAEEGPLRQVEACVFNASQEPKRDLALRVNAFDGKVEHLYPTASPPVIVADGTLRVPGELRPGDGVIVTGQLDVSKASAPPAEFEAVADRVDLIR